MKKIFPKQNKGFVALFTVLLAAVILSMAVGIANIALKQIVLSASATDANKSFYAADSGIECVLYQDIRNAAATFDSGNTTFNINCGGNTILVGQTSPGFFPEFAIPFGENEDACAYVMIDKSDPNITKVTSRGVNVPCGTTNPRMVERSIYVTY